MCAALCGLAVLPGVNMANSVVTVLSEDHGPSAQGRCTLAASQAGRCPA